MTFSDNDWLRILSGLGVRPTTAAEWAAPFADEIQPELFSAGMEDVQAFIPQLLHEYALLEKTEECLSYTPERICEVWPSRFPTLASAIPYSHSPAKLANCVYANRMGNGPAAFDEVLITTRNRNAARIIVDFLYFRDRTGGSSMRINVNAVVLGFQVYVSDPYSGAQPTATMIITRPSGEGATPYTQTINLKNTGGRRMGGTDTAGATTGDTLQVVPPTFHKQINFQTNNDLSDEAIAGYVVIEIAPNS